MSLKITQTINGQRILNLIKTFLQKQAKISGYKWVKEGTYSCGYIDMWP